MAEEDETKVLEAAKKLPLSEQVVHKNWKVRSQAYDGIKATCESAMGSEDAALAEFGPVFAKAVGDTNANAVDKALDALQAYLLLITPDQAARLAEPVCKVMASKDLKHRPGTVQRVGNNCALFVELEQPDAVLTPLFAAFGDKVPKVVTAAVEIVLQLVSAFGCKAVPAKPILAAVPKLFDAKQEPIRDAVKRLSAELSAYIGPEVVKATLCDKMPDVMRKDVEKLLEAQAGTPRKLPERFTRTEQAARAARVASGAGGAEPSGPAGPSGGVAAAAEAEADTEGMDPYEFAEPVDVTKQLDKDFWSGLGEAKWQLRRDSLKRLRDVCAAPRLIPGDFGDLMRELKKICNKDSNVVCIGEAIGCIGNMASGLRSDFASQARAWAPVLLDKLKDKNLAVCNNSISGLKTFFRHCIALADVADDVTASLEHKNPKQRLETLKLLQVIVESTPKAPVAKAAPLLLQTVAKVGNDPAPDIRETALCTLVAFALKMGSSLPAKVTEHLDDIRKKRFEELIQQARSQGAAPRPGSASASGAPAASSAPTAAAPKPLGPSNTSSARPLTTRSASSKRAAPALGKSASAKAAGGSAAGSAVADDDDASLAAGSLGRDEAISAMETNFDEAVVKDLRSDQWKLRKEAMEAMLASISDHTESWADAHAYEVIQGISYLPGWGEKNFQVLAKAFEAITALVNKTSNLVKKAGFVALIGVVDKMSDAKLKGAGSDVLTALAEAIGPQFVVTQLHKKAAAHKSPKVLSEAIAWMAKSIEEFGLPAFSVAAILQWAKEDLASTNAPVRNAAVALLATCHKQLGPGLAPMIQTDVKPAQWTLLEEAFAANPQQQVVPTRQSRRPVAGRAPTGKGASTAKGAAAAAAEPPAPVSADDLLPRADISSSITPSLLASLNNAQWKERNLAVGSIENVLKGAGGRIQPTINELLSALKARLGDANRNLAARVLLLTAELVKALGPACDRTAGRQLLQACVGLLYDNKKQVRDAVMAAAGAQERPGSASGTSTARALGPSTSAKADSGLPRASGRSTPVRSLSGSRPATPPQPSPREVTPPAPSGQIRGDSCLRMDNRKTSRAQKARFKPGGFEAPKKDDLADLQQELEPLASEGLRPLLVSTDFQKQTKALEALFHHMQTQDLFLSDHEASCIVPCLVDRAGHNQERLRNAHAELLLAACAISPPPRVIDAVAVGLGSKSNRTRIVCMDVLAGILKAHNLDIFLQCRSSPFRLVAQMVSERDAATRTAVLRTLEALYLAEGPEMAWECIGDVSSQQRSLIQERFKYVDRQAQRFGRDTAGRDTAAAEGATTRRGTDAADSSRLLKSPRHTTTDELPSISTRPSSHESNGYSADAAAPNGNAAHANGHSTGIRPPPYSADTPPHLRPQPDTAASHFTSPRPTPLPQRPSIQVGPDWVLGAPSPVPPTLGPTLSNGDFAEVWYNAVANADDDHLEDAVAAMKVLCFELDSILQAAAKGHSPNREREAVLKSTADDLVISLAHKIKQTVQLAVEDAGRLGDKGPMLGSGYRGAKYTLSALMHVFSVPAMATAVTAHALQPLAGILLVLLLDTATASVGQDGHVQKGANVLMMKIVSQADQTNVFRVLLALLLDPPPMDHLDDDVRLRKFPDLVVRCLIRCTKRVSSLSATQLIQEVRMEELLMGVHGFLDSLGVDEVRQRGAQDDKPLRMVKTLVHELCKALGQDIRRYMRAIPRNEGEIPPIIQAYVDLNLNILKTHDMPARNEPQASLPSSGMVRPSMAPVELPPHPDAPPQSPPIRARGGLSPETSPDSACTGSYSATASPDERGGSADAEPISPKEHLRAKLVSICKSLRDNNHDGANFEELSIFIEQNPDIDVMATLEGANTSPEFCAFLTLKLDEAAKDRRARAMAEARRGLHMASEPDSDAISVPDNNSPEMPEPRNPTRESYDKVRAMMDSRRASGTEGAALVTPRGELANTPEF
ncbi:hypothetical protein WJX73_007429 [Symbiochloris irregularis]|uniref:TOG domain-containing protein n=1 Tax=Symbiochloris irregularis TaxID=706552 RepID=A0AAW1NX75_9CHLO